MLRDAYEQTQLAQAEIVSVREKQSETRSWVLGVEQSVAELRGRVGEVLAMGPTLEVLQSQAQRVGETLANVESRRELAEDLNRRLVTLGAESGQLEERGRQLHAQMDAAEERFGGLSSSAAEAERLAAAIAGVQAEVGEAGRKSEEIGEAVSGLLARCQSVEKLADETQALRPELEQRHHALREAAKDLQRASALRKEGAASAQKLEDLSQELAGAITNADRQLAELDERSSALGERIAGLAGVEQRLNEFEARLSKWGPVEKEMARTLDQIAGRQGTVEALQADVERIFATAERTTSDIREISDAREEVERSRNLLADVMERLSEVRGASKALDDRKRQMTRVEERLSRADALLADVRSSLEALQGQKALVDQAVEKAGSLQFLVKQADAAMTGLREERELALRVQSAVAATSEEEDDEEEHARAA
jgi:chromosome segregation ATPase